MSNLEILHFEQLKNKVQAQYLENHAPSFEDISKWKGIDIIYFQEDLRQKAKGNISEKSFYTYFRTSPVTKVPRIDMLNILSVYVGYQSWYDFKKQNLFKNEVLNESEILNENEDVNPTSETLTETLETKPQEEIQNEIPEAKKDVLQISATENQKDSVSEALNKNLEKPKSEKKKSGRKNYFWIAASAVLLIAAGFFGFKDNIFQKQYTYCFRDADRNSPIKYDLLITVKKENESPLTYRIKSGECFSYSTKDKTLNMKISSPVYQDLEMSRNLENAPEEETILLKPDDYKMAVDYFSKKNSAENPDELNQKRQQLENRISNKATIYQVFESDIYGIETMDKQKYITLVTTPTTSLKNLNVIEMKTDGNGKIVLIKFKITDDETNH
ncbi:MAG: hypothetical protein LBE36_11775 [Flavobacteriaceae bacterium]|nr:hypothetical protein [Flavobacteriaceae bacterium]